jgi:hypothetical protein
MSDAPQGPDWWQASDGQWYPPDPIAGGIHESAAGRPWYRHGWVIGVGLLTLVAIAVAVGVVVGRGSETTTSSVQSFGDATSTIPTAPPSSTPTTVPATSTSVHVPPATGDLPKITRDQVPEYMHAIWDTECVGANWGAPHVSSQSDCTCLFDQIQDHITMSEFMAGISETNPVMVHAVLACHLLD